MTSVRAIKNNIIFQFEDKTVRKANSAGSHTQFSETTEWGFEISNYDESAKHHRWARVVSVGPKVVEDIQIGSRILIEALQWTDAMKVNGISYWGTNETKVMVLDENFQS